MVHKKVIVDKIKPVAHEQERQDRIWLNWDCDRRICKAAVAIKPEHKRKNGVLENSEKWILIE